MEYDVVVVGAGPAGLAAAIGSSDSTRFERRRRRKGPGRRRAYSLGAVVDPVSLDRLIPDWREDPDGRPKTAVAALSEQRQVVCVGRSTRRPKRRLGREGAPLGQRGGAPLFVNLAGDEMALLIEMVVDLGMN